MSNESETPANAESCGCESETSACGLSIGEHCVIAAIILLLGGVFGFLTGTCIGEGSGAERVWADAVRNGAAEHDAYTGRKRWKSASKSPVDRIRALRASLVEAEADLREMERRAIAGESVNVHQSGKH